MDLKDLELLLMEASRRTRQTEFVIVGSLSILGVLGSRPVPREIDTKINAAYQMAPTSCTLRTNARYPAIPNPYYPIPHTLSQANDPAPKR